MLEVFPTSRAIRSFYEQFIDTNTLLPKAITMAELEQKAVLVPNRALVDEDMRVLFMQEASRFTRLELLHIEREFFTFLKNATYLFRFFEELASEKVSIEALKGADTYAQYEEHLEVLQTLLQHYKALLDKKALYDRITVVEHYVVNDAYVRSLGAIRIHLEGFLSRFEMDLLVQISQTIPVYIRLTRNAYNHKMGTLLSGHGIVLEEGGEYEIDLSTKTILHVSQHKDHQPCIDVNGFSSRMAQVAYIHNAIARFVEEGLKPSDIAVVLPDESFASSLKALDRWHNLNFAMGISLKESHFYQMLSAIDKFMRKGEIEDHLRLKRLGIDEDATVLTCKTLWHQHVSPDVAISWYRSVLGFNQKEAQNPLFQETMFSYEHFLTSAPPLRFSQMMTLLLNRLSRLREDDVGGGQVTVLGVLETRGVSYAGVIVPDFNDDCVPKRSQKDLFLSSTVRSHAGLPTKRDRENLQRYFYAQLFSKAKYICIAYVHNALSQPSRFLEELGLLRQQSVDEKALYTLLFTPRPLPIPYAMPFIDAPYDLRATPLSATKLKTLLTCQRKFYFRYIAKIKEANMPNANVDEQVIGVALHEVLERVIRPEVLYDEKRLFHAIQEGLKAKREDEVWGYFCDLWLKKLRPFMALEIERFAQGYRTLYKEFSHSISYKGFLLEGKMDRIDIKEGRWIVLDYKSGTIPTSTEKSVEKNVDFQMVFYALLASSLGELEGVFYYDLKEGKLIPELFLEEKKAFLDAHLEKLSTPINGYALCDEIKHCRLCPYVMLCGKEELV